MTTVKQFRGLMTPIRIFRDGVHPREVWVRPSLLRKWNSTSSGDINHADKMPSYSNLKSAETGISIAVSLFSLFQILLISVSSDCWADVVASGNRRETTCATAKSITRQ